MKKVVVKPQAEHRAIIDKADEQLCVVKQCELLQLSRSGLYYEPVKESAENLTVMRFLDEQYLSTPYYGTKRLLVLLVVTGYRINAKRLRRLMKRVGWQTLYCTPRTTQVDGSGLQVSLPAQRPTDRAA